MLARRRDRSFAAVQAAAMIPDLEAEIRSGVRQGDAIEWASKLTGVGKRQIHLVLQVKQASPAMLERVKLGELSLHWAYDHLLGSEQRRAVKYPTERGASPVKVRPNARSIAARPVVCKAELRRMVEACSQIAGFAKGLDKLHVDRICNNGNSVGIDYWDRVLTQAGVDLRVFKKKLRTEYERKIGPTDPAKERADQDDKGSGAFVEDSSDGSEASGRGRLAVDDGTSRS